MGTGTSAVLIDAIDIIFKRKFKHKNDYPLLIGITKERPNPKAFPDDKWKKDTEQALKRLNRTIKKMKDTDRFRYLSGRYVEKISNKELLKGTKAKIITDFFGATSYTLDYSTLLNKYLQLLDEDGAIYFVSDLQQSFFDELDNQINIEKLFEKYSKGLKLTRIQGNNNALEFATYKLEKTDKKWFFPQLKSELVSWDTPPQINHRLDRNIEEIKIKHHSIIDDFLLGSKKTPNHAVYNTVYDIYADEGYSEASKVVTRIIQYENEYDVANFISFFFNKEKSLAFKKELNKIIDTKNHQYIKALINGLFSKEFSKDLNVEFERSVKILLEKTNGDFHLNSIFSFPELHFHDDLLSEVIKSYDHKYLSEIIYYFYLHDSQESLNKSGRELIKKCEDIPACKEDVFYKSVVNAINSK
jgi:hypothetical protein